MPCWVLNGQSSLVVLARSVDIFVNHLLVNHEMDTQWKKVKSKEKQVSLIFPRHVSLSWQKCSFVVEFYRPSYKKSKTTKGNVLQSPRVQGGHFFFLIELGEKPILILSTFLLNITTIAKLFCLTQWNKILMIWLLLKDKTWTGP